MKILMVIQIALSLFIILKLKQMANENKQKFEEVLSKIDEATNEVSTELDTLRQTLADGGMADADEDEVLAKLDALSTRLKGLAADPNNPVPEPVNG